MQTSRRATRIAQLTTRRQQIAARAKDADKRIGTQLRQLQTHEAKAERDISLDWLDEQIQALTRPDDRALFGLDREPSADADEAEPSAARPAPPITARQKKLLARLVDEHPEFAREFGVDPDEPELETLDKAKAASLIEAMLDRLNAQAPPDER